MERTQLFDLMGELKLHGMKAAFDEIMATAIKRQHEPQRVVGDLLQGAAVHGARRAVDLPLLQQLAHHQAGAAGLVRQARHSAPLDGATAKASAGAVNYVRIATVVNISRAIEEFKAMGVWTIGLDASAIDPYDSVDYTLPTALVLGAEGTGLRRLVRETCDRLVGIPMAGEVSSLNVSVSAGVALFEAARQRRAGGPRGGGR